MCRWGARLRQTGLGIGLVGAFAPSRLVASVIFGVTATDPLTFGAVAAVLTVVSVLASYIPARSAARIDPMEALRIE